MFKALRVICWPKRDNIKMKLLHNIRYIDYSIMQVIQFFNVKKL
jgi:hypothetical protein